MRLLTPHTRMSFLRLAALACCAGLAGSRSRVWGANDDLRLAVIGLGGKGGQHVELFSRTPGVRVAALGGHTPVTEGFTRLVKSLEGVGVDLGKTPFALGPWLELDPASGDILKVGGGDAGQLAQARQLARGTHRAPFVFPT